MKTIAVYLEYEPYPKQGGMERVTDTLLRMLSAHYKVLIVCKKKNRLGDTYICPVPIHFLSGTLKEQQQQFINLMQENQVDILIDQLEGGVIGRYGIFKKRSLLHLPDLQSIAVQHNSAMSILKNYYIVKQKQDSYTCINWCYNKLVLPVLKKRAYWLQSTLAKDLSLNYDKIVTLSDAFIPHFFAFAPQTPKNKVVSISDPNTYEEPVNKTKQEKTVLFVGRLDNKSKGVDRLLRIWKRVESEQTDWKLKIVGGGQDKTMLMDLSRQLHLRQVSFEGFQMPKSYYEEASIFCLTSTFEGFGMVLTEAMQHGVVPVAFDSYDALRDIVTDRSNGYTIPPFDEMEYARKVKFLMNHKSTLKSMSEQAIIDSKKFSRENIAKKWYDLIESL